MPKNSTYMLQDAIMQMGVKLGFVASAEFSYPTVTGAYTPRYDVGWFLDLEGRLDPSPLAALLGKSHPWMGYLKRLPVAVFEIEGSTTSSKNQIGNFANLFMSPALFRFAVVDNPNCGHLLGKIATRIPGNQQYTAIQKAGDYYYVPKIDIVGGFHLQTAFSRFLAALSCSVGVDSWNYPILQYYLKHPDEKLFFPLIAVESYLGLLPRL